jgi:hypothetical protein
MLLRDSSGNRQRESKGSPKYILPTTTANPTRRLRGIPCASFNSATYGPRNKVGSSGYKSMKITRTG